MPSNEEKIAFLNMAHYVQLEKAYKEQWCYVLFKVKFDEWPGNFYKAKVPQAPDTEFLKFVANYQKIGGENARATTR